MAVLSDLSCPGELAYLSDSELDELTQEIRQFLIEKVQTTGGHLGPNLGVVELTLAVHRVFQSPRDPILFDTGHICYVHKILTGRQSQFDTLRQAGGLSGYPSRSESSHDWLESSHASSALSWGTGMAEAFHLRGDPHTVVVVVGDGALTGGMAWEALNNIAVRKDLRMVIVVNDNGRSYTPTVGGLARQLAGIRTDRRYDPTMDVVKTVVQKTPLVGKPAYELLHGLKVGLKDILAPQGLFSDLGLKYIGPIDGHDRPAIEQALTQAKHYDGPVMVHCITKKGHGFADAEQNDEDRHHAVDAMSPSASRKKASSAKTWTTIFGEEMVRLARKDPSLVAISAAMVNPVGLGPMMQAYRTRVFDVGIAEQHAIASAAGMAMAGLKPVVAVYATFLNRGFDQILMDVGLHSMPVTFVLDRAGITGPDGASHHGIWDLSILGDIPGIRVAAPRDSQTLTRTLTQAVGERTHPTAIRFPKGEVPSQITPVRQESGLDILADHETPEVTIIGYGPMTHLALGVAHELESQEIAVRVIDPVWVLPVSSDLVSLAGQSTIVVTLEDGIDDGGVGQKLEICLADASSPAVVMRWAVPTSFVPQGTREVILEDLGFTVPQIVEHVLQKLASLR
ncbi:MAG: 1-deoxy-D-xylulose-5-phosphate synthase [Propionibacteriaceae bacterium]|jgi:1-deoxy-D-xylulose-5-phosphate synthase|nr:1-deoxy-D-xylulose-5-phosphate synthase [Propionibacteriaceae bacterium]